MRYLGGQQTDPMRPELETLEGQPKRGTGPGGLYYPPCGYPIAKIRQTVVQAIGTGAFATILMDTTDLDNDGMADLANDQIKIKFPGIYLLTGKVAFVAGAATARHARFFISGVASGDCGPFAGGLTPPRIPCHDLVSLGRNATVKLQGFQDTGGNLNTNVVAADVQSTLWVVWVGAN